MVVHLNLLQSNKPSLGAAHREALSTLFGQQARGISTMHVKQPSE